MHITSTKSLFSRNFEFRRYLTYGAKLYYKKTLTALEYPLPALPSEELLNLLSLLDAGGDHAEPLSDGILTTTTVSHHSYQPLLTRY